MKSRMKPQMKMSYTYDRIVLLSPFFGYFIGEEIAPHLEEANYISKSVRKLFKER